MPAECIAVPAAEVPGTGAWEENGRGATAAQLESSDVRLGATASHQIPRDAGRDVWQGTQIVKTADVSGRIVA